MPSPLDQRLHPAILLIAGFFAGAAAFAVFRPDPEASVVRVTLPPEARPSPRPKAPASATLPSSVADAGQGPLARAASGDLDALKALEEKGEAERTTEESVAIAEGRTELARRDLSALVAATSEAPELASDRQTLSRLFDFIAREPIAIEALTALSSLPGPESVDLLDAEWQARKSTTVGLFARDLCRGPARAKASEALSIKLDLETLTEARPLDDARALTRCERTRDLFGRVEAHGDRRLAPLFEKLDERSGCGPDRRGDCYACLRDDPRVETAKEAALARKIETPWILRRR